MHIITLILSMALSQLVYEIRQPELDGPHFRKNVQKIGEQLALQVLEDLETQEVSVTTLTEGVATHTINSEVPVLVTILRAGLPLTLGLHKVFPKAEVGFLAMSRNEETLKADLDYVALPALTDKTVIIADTMLATGGSILDTIKIVESYHPKRIVVVAAIAAEQGIERIQAYDSSIKVYAAAVDPILNEKGYIVPGLGDAGDRSYGLKAHTK